MLEEFGATVKWYDDRPSNNFLSKALIRINKNFIKKKIFNYYKAIIEQIKIDNLHFDYVFFLNPEAISVTSLRQLKIGLPGAKFILYMWDSFKNRKTTAELMPFFDNKFTFDPRDAQNFGLKLRPLFYIDLYSAKGNGKLKYDLLFIGTAHTDRYKLLDKIRNQFSDKFIIKEYFFLGSKMLFWAKKIIEKDFRNVSYGNISFSPLTHKNNSELVQQSKAVLDINHPGQLGLTMRTFEVLGSGRKLITTNADVVNYDFYNKNNILIIDRLNPVIDKQFLLAPFMPVSDNILKKYHLRGWIAELFEIV
ncbi:hypothetical protein [Mucilaginibacter flavidus]|uniref:hypothetical protein n=1 Tax=Mucilaginibacter flavidus TaxID=2949309 RepID=UPI00209321CB|nr:hypothetical protein [Mucilaginibacter flavidus]MCO5947246.1 hypothetical protein [Mucilaginibacter flavidus]